MTSLEKITRGKGLDRCPFCGTWNVHVHVGHKNWVQCGRVECFAQGPTRDSERGAIAAWNKAWRVGRVEPANDPDSEQRRHELRERLKETLNEEDEDG